jgi:uroporphyrinogen-III synthase
MDRELAKHVVAVGFHSLSLLQSLIPILKEHCAQEEYTKYLSAIGAVSAEMTTEIFNEVFQEHPDLEAEIEAKIEKYGQFI